MSPPSWLLPNMNLQDPDADDLSSDGNALRMLPLQPVVGYPHNGLIGALHGSSMTQPHQHRLSYVNNQQQSIPMQGQALQDAAYGSITYDPNRYENEVAAQGFLDVGGLQSSGQHFITQQPPQRYHFQPQVQQYDSSLYQPPHQTRQIDPRDGFDRAYRGPELYATNSMRFRQFEGQPRQPHQRQPAPHHPTGYRATPPVTVDSWQASAIGYIPQMVNVQTVVYPQGHPAVSDPVSPRIQSGAIQEPGNRQKRKSDDVSHSQRTASKKHRTIGPSAAHNQNVPEPAFLATDGLRQATVNTAQTNRTVRNGYSNHLGQARSSPASGVKLQNVANGIQATSPTTTSAVKPGAPLASRNMASNRGTGVSTGAVAAARKIQAKAKPSKPNFTCNHPLPPIMLPGITCSHCRAETRETLERKKRGAEEAITSSRTWDQRKGGDSPLKEAHTLQNSQFNFLKKDVVRAGGLSKESETKAQVGYSQQSLGALPVNVLKGSSETPGQILEVNRTPSNSEKGEGMAGSQTQGSANLVKSTSSSRPKSTQVGDQQRDNRSLAIDVPNTNNHGHLVAETDAQPLVPDLTEFNEEFMVNRRATVRKSPKETRKLPKVAVFRVDPYIDRESGWGWIIKGFPKRIAVPQSFTQRPQEDRKEVNWSIPYFYEHRETCKGCNSCFAIQEKLEKEGNYPLCSCLPCRQECEVDDEFWIIQNEDADAKRIKRSAVPFLQQLHESGEVLPVPKLLQMRKLEKQDPGDE